MKHPFVAYAAFDGEKIQVDAFSFDQPFAQWLKIIVFIKSDREF